MLNTLPDLHRSFAEQLKLKLQSDSRIHSLLAGGSFIHGGFDQYSDLDFVVVVDPFYYDEIMAQRMAFAGTLGHLLHAFTGEHVGEPRLLICLFGPLSSSSFMAFLKPLIADPRSPPSVRNFLVPNTKIISAATTSSLVILISPIANLLL